MQINLDQFNIPEMYNKEYLYTLLKDEPIEDIEEMFIKTATQFKRDLKEWFPDKPKTGSFRTYFKSLEPTKKEVILDIENIPNWGDEEFETLYNLKSMGALKYKNALKTSNKRHEYDVYIKNKETVY